MKGADLYRMRNALLELSQVKNKRTAYMCVKNRPKVERAIRQMEEGMAISPDHPMAKYDEARLEVCREYAEKDSAGMPIVIKDGPQKGNFKIPDEKKQEFEETILKLKEIYKDALEERNKVIARYNEMCEADVATELIESLHKIALSELPEEVTGEQLLALGDLVIYEEPDGTSGLKMVW